MLETILSNTEKRRKARSLAKLMDSKNARKVFTGSYLDFFEALLVRVGQTLTVVTGIAHAVGVPVLLEGVGDVRASMSSCQLSVEGFSRSFSRRPPPSRAMAMGRSVWTWVDASRP